MNNKTKMKKKKKKTKCGISLKGVDLTINPMIPSWACSRHCLFISSSANFGHFMLTIQSLRLNPQCIPKGLVPLAKCTVHISIKKEAVRNLSSSHLSLSLSKMIYPLPHC
jgi:hypothetical protein